jgi:hypothetical protein
VLGLLERERRLDPSVKDDVAILAQGFEPTQGTGLVRADRALTKAWLGYLARRRGSKELVPGIEAPRILPSNELDVVVLELAIVEPLGRWAHRTRTTRTGARLACTRSGLSRAGCGATPAGSSSWTVPGNNAASSNPSTVPSSVWPSKPRLPY